MPVKRIPGESEEAYKARSIQYRKEYREKNKAKILAKAKLYQQKNKDKIQAYRKDRYIAKGEEIREKATAYRRANPEKVAAGQQAYRESHKESIKARQQRWREENIERCTERDRAYHQAHREERLAYGREYYRNNKGALNEASQAYRKAHSEELSAQGKRYYADNREELLAAQKLYREANKENIASANKRWREANVEKLRAYEDARRDSRRDEYLAARPARLAQGRKYRGENAEKERLRFEEKKNRYLTTGGCRSCGKPRLPHSNTLCLAHWFAGISGATGFSKYAGLGWPEGGARIAEILTSDCPYTGGTLTPGLNASLDHVLPKSRFPERRGDLSNLEWCDLSINTSKRYMTREEFVATCAFVTLRGLGEHVQGLLDIGLPAFLFCRTLKVSNPDMTLERSIRNSLTRRGLRGAAVKALIPALVSKFYAQGGRCAYTGVDLTPGVNLSLDHRYPAARFAEKVSDIENLEWVDLTINHMKRDRTPEEFMAMCSLVASRAKLLGVEKVAPLIGTDILSK